MPTTPKLIRANSFSGAFMHICLHIGTRFRRIRISGTTCRESLQYYTRAQLFRHKKHLGNILRRSVTIEFDFPVHTIRGYRNPQLARTNAQRFYHSLGHLIDVNDPDIGRMLDRFVGVVFAAMFPGKKIPGYRGIVRKDRSFKIRYQLPPGMLRHPALIHLFVGLARDALYLTAMGHTEYFLPAATDEEVEAALKGDHELARQIVDCLMPNYERTTRAFSRTAHRDLYNYCCEVGTLKAFTAGVPMESFWALDSTDLYYSKYDREWQARRYWDAGHVNSLAPKHRKALKARLAERDLQNAGIKPEEVAG